ncbi:MAG: redox-regulated ATPase YchF [Candidatus Woesearchaeota archaeon]|nr:MAG: redox-regulated ATPase YchF [Candidatus Woesearchaeota archaeon]
MIIGLVGLPSSGKSTFFKAATLAEVEIANYPFTTIKKNEGIGYIKVDCVDKEFNTSCNPRFGYCIDNKRFVPVQMIDVAGLVEGAHQGKGMGNQFLSDLNEADVLIHVVDISGSTNDKGEPVEALSHDPLKNIQILEDELDQWYYGLIQKNWEKFSHKIKQEGGKIEKALAKQLSGLKVTEEMILDSIRKFPEEFQHWKEKELLTLAKELRNKTKPTIIAANKINVLGSYKNFERIKKEYPSYTIIPCSAESELALKEAHKKNLIKYIPGSNNFEVISFNLNEKQKKALEFIKKNILDKFNSTGVQECLDKAVLEILNYIAIFPGGVGKLTDSEGRRLPDCFLLPENSTALDFAFKVHTDLGKNFIRAIDVKTKRTIGKEHKLKHRDVIEIIT